MINSLGRLGNCHSGDMLFAMVADEILGKAAKRMETGKQMKEGFNNDCSV